MTLRTTLAGVADAVASLLHPWLFMGRALGCLPPTLLRLLRARQWATLARWGRVRQAWFGAFWRWAGPRVRAGGEAVVVPLLQGRVRHGRVLPAAAPSDGNSSSGSDKAERRRRLLPPVGGVVVEVGPGSGMWVSAIAAAATSSGSSSGSSRKSKHRKSASGITKIYGVEPNPAVHDSLRARAAAAGLGAVYEIVPVGLEDVMSAGSPARIPPASVDCVVCVLCLCGIPAPDANVRALYALLKPGGRLYVYEHVRATRSRWVQAHQWLVNLVWPAVMGGCQLRRDTERALRAAGPWAAVDLAAPVDEPWYHTIPHIVGVLTK